MPTPENSSFLRRVLLADGALSGLAGVLLAVAAHPLQELLGVPAALLRYAGLCLVPFGALLVYLSGRPALPRAAVVSVIVLNGAWAAASVLLLFAIQPNAWGLAVVLGQAAAVGFVAEMEARGLRRAS